MKLKFARSRRARCTCYVMTPRRSRLPLLLRRLLRLGRGFPRALFVLVLLKHRHELLPERVRGPHLVEILRRGGMRLVRNRACSMTWRIERSRRARGADGEETDSTRRTSSHSSRVNNRDVKTERSMPSSSNVTPPSTPRRPRSCARFGAAASSSSFVWTLPRARFGLYRGA